MIAVRLALQDIATAQDRGDITIAQAGAIVASTAARISATATKVDPMDLAIAVAKHLGMTENRRLALIKGALSPQKEV